MVASYLFRTSDDEMAAYRAAAKAAGQPFAQWLRDAADAHHAGVTAAPSSDAATVPTVALPRSNQCPSWARHRSEVYCKTCGQVPR